MNSHRFLSIVPGATRTAAAVLVACAALIGAIVGFVQRVHGGTFARSPVLPSLAGVGIGLLTGVVVAVWVLCLGYVYGDARRRGMPPVLWTLVAVLVPNLLGFLLYFAMRRPLASFCTQCGRPMMEGHQFCSWCGHQQPSTPFGSIARPGEPGLDASAKA